MERLRKLVERLQKRNIYILPFPEGTQVERVEKDSPMHVGDYEGAIDFIVPLGTTVLAPQDGVVVDVVDDKILYGPTIEYVQSLNVITISHSNGEYSQVAHLKKGSATVREREQVRKGQVIAITGLSGYMTEPHLHFFVFKIRKKGGFKGITPRFEKEIK